MLTENGILQETLGKWKHYKQLTRNHAVLCDCKDCHTKYKLAAKMDLPYACERSEDITVEMCRLR